MAWLLASAVGLAIGFGCWLGYWLRLLARLCFASTVGLAVWHGYAWLWLYGLAIGFSCWLGYACLQLYGLALAWLLALVQLAVVWKLEMLAVSNFYEEGNGPFSVRTEFC